MAKATLLATHILELETRMGTCPVGGFSFDFPSGGYIEPHYHFRGQIVYAPVGVMTVMTRRGSWVIPPQRAVWIPPQIPHEIRVSTSLEMRNLLINADYAPLLPTEPSVYNVTPLVRELILRSVALPHEYGSGTPLDRILQLLLDELEQLSVVPLSVPDPKDPRLKKICSAIRDDPADSRTLSDWAAVAGASSRTLERLFIKETGMSFAHWRRQVRLLDAMIKLGEGHPVSAVAYDMGYESVSGFVEMFRRITGVTPGRYFSRENR